MKMTLKEANEKYLGLASLGKLTLPIKLRHAITCNLDALQKHAEHIEKVRKELCEQYAKKDEDGNPAMIESIVNGAKRSNYDMDSKTERIMNREFEEFLETEEVDVEIRKADFILLEECEKNERYSIPTVAQQMAMLFMLKE